MPWKKLACADIERIIADKGGQVACAGKVKKHKPLTVIAVEVIHFTFRYQYIIRCFNVMCIDIKCTIIQCTLIKILS